MSMIDENKSKMSFFVASGPALGKMNLKGHTLVPCGNRETGSVSTFLNRTRTATATPRSGMNLAAIVASLVFAKSINVRITSGKLAPF